MRFSIQRETFLKQLRAVAGVVERRHNPISPILSHLLIQVENGQVTLTTTDQEVELIASVAVNELSAGTVTVPFRKLIDICRVLPETTPIEFVEESARVTLRAGRSRFTLLTLPVQDFPNLNSTNTAALETFSFSISKRSLHELINCTSFAMAEQDVRYYLNAMLLEIKDQTLYAVATDGHRLALNRLEISAADGLALRIIVPRKGILELQRILDEGEGEIALTVGKNHLRVQTDSITLTTKLLEGRFPDYERIIPKGGNRVVVGKREELKEAFHRASALFSDRFRGIRLHIREGCLKVLARNAEQDEVEEDIEVDYQGAPLEVGFNVKYLIDFLNIIQTEAVRLTFVDSNQSATLHGVGEVAGCYVIMPMKI